MLTVEISNKVLEDAIEASRKNYNADKPVNKQFDTDEEYAKALVSFALRQQLGVKEEMGAREGVDTFADQLERERKGGLASGANIRKDEKTAGLQNANKTPIGSGVQRT